MNLERTLPQRKTKNKVKKNLSESPALQDLSRFCSLWPYCKKKIPFRVIQAGDASQLIAENSICHREMTESESESEVNLNLNDLLSSYMESSLSSSYSRAS